MIGGMGTRRCISTVPKTSHVSQLVHGGSQRVANDIASDRLVRGPRVGSGVPKGAMGATTPVKSQGMHRISVKKLLGSTEAD